MEVPQVRPEINTIQQFDERTGSKYENTADKTFQVTQIGVVVD